MIITYFRSSSFNSWSFCPFQSYLVYTLNWKPTEPFITEPDGTVVGANGLVLPKPSFKADQGNTCHKALELLARQKLAVQQGKAEFSEDEIGKTWRVDSFTTDDAFEEAWKFYSKVRCRHWNWDSKIYKKCRGWYLDTLNFNGGRFNPLNRKVIEPEQYFDIPFDEPWAKYSFKLPNGEWLEGQLAIKGTMDLVTEEDSDTLEYLDWKTGMRKDWATGKPKDWKKLRDDPQMRIYHYALSKLHPQYKHIIMTVVWCQDGGAFPLDFGPEDLPKTVSMLRERFETIRDCEMPPRIVNDRVNNAGQWKCKYLCPYGMSYLGDGDKNVCDQVHGELQSLGMSRVTAKYAQGTFGAYGAGGGRADRDKLNGVEK